MANWSPDEVKELLRISDEAEIARQLTGTVKDSAIYKNIALLIFLSLKVHLK